MTTDLEAVIKANAPFAPGACGFGLKESALEVLHRHGSNADIKDVMNWCAQVVSPLVSRIPGAIEESVPFYGALYQWAQLGCPHFSLTPDFFHAIALTDFGDPSEEPLYMPFHAFTLSFPKTDFLADASRMMIYRVPAISYSEATLIKELKWKLYRATLLKDSPIFTQWTIGMTRKELAAEAAKMDANVPGEGVRPLDQSEKHLPLRMRTILANVMSYVESHGPLPTIPRSRKNATPAPVELTHTDRPLYEVGRTVKLGGKLRKALLEHKSSSVENRWHLSTRFVVRGHWRNQAYGEGRQLRKRLWVEPFYKGPATLEAALDRTYEIT